MGASPATYVRPSLLKFVTRDLCGPLTSGKHRHETLFLTNGIRPRLGGVSLLLRLRSYLTRLILKRVSLLVRCTSHGIGLVLGRIGPRFNSSVCAVSGTVLHFAGSFGRATDRGVFA